MLRLARAAWLAGAIPDLKVIFNLGAGVDHTLADPALPDLPLVRARIRI